MAKERLSGLRSLREDVVGEFRLHPQVKWLARRADSTHWYGFRAGLPADGSGARTQRRRVTWDGLLASF